MPPSRMPDDSLVALFVRPLNRAGIPYLVTGGVATIVYGEPRFTRDVDLILHVRPADAAALIAAWDAAAFYLPLREVVEREAARTAHGHFNIIHVATGLRADCYVAGDDPLHTWALAHPRVERVGDDAVRLAPIEYVIVRKLEYFRDGASDRHLSDIAAMVRISENLIDRDTLDSLVRQRRLEGEWRRAVRHDLP